MAACTDIKQRIVSDKISYGLIAAGIGLHGAESLFAGNYSPLFASVGVCIATFVVGLVFWKIGLWAGGDVKLFTGIAAMAPFNPNIIGSALGIELFKASALPIFPLSLFIFSVFAMLPYGLFLGFVALGKKREKKKKIIADFKQRALQLLELAIATTGFSELLNQLNLNVLLVLPVLVVLGIVPKTIRIVAIVLVAFFALAQLQWLFFAETIYLFAVLFVFFAIIKLAAESQGLLNARKKITELKDGDIVAETIIMGNDGILRYSGVSIAKIINYLKTNNLQAIKELLAPAGKVFCSHRRAGGVSEEEIAELKKLVEKKLLEDSIEVKQSVAFVPAVLIAFVLLNILGDLIWNVFLV